MLPFGALNAAAFAKHVAKVSKYQVQLYIKKKEESERKKLKAKQKLQFIEPQVLL